MKCRGAGLILATCSILWGATSFCQAETLREPPNLFRVIIDTFHAQTWKVSDDYVAVSYGILEKGKPLTTHIREGKHIIPARLFPSPWDGYKDLAIQIDTIGDRTKISVFTKGGSPGKSDSITSRRCQQKTWGCVSFTVTLPSEDMDDYMRPWLERYLNDVRTARSRVLALQESGKQLNKKDETLIMDYP